MVVLGAFFFFVSGDFVCVCVLKREFVDNLRRNILRDRKLHQQVNDSAGVVVHPPTVTTTLPKRPRSPLFKRNIDQQPIPSCASNNSSIVSYMHKWQVTD